MLRSNLCDYCDSCILVSGTIIIAGDAADDATKRTEIKVKGVKR